MANAVKGAAIAGAQTFIFVDVDGVLNVGIRDHGRAPLLLNEENCDVAAGIEDLDTLVGDERECIEKVLAVMRHSVGKSDVEVYKKLACSSRLQCSGLLVARLADIIRAGGDRCSVVLSSNWRRPKYTKKVSKLEDALSVYLGRAFKFDAATAQAEEATASDRLSCIGAHLARVCDDAERTGPIKVLVLDDFFITPLNGWACQGNRMTETAHVESYLRGCCKKVTDVAIKLVHCYEEWATPSGLHIQVGSGLTSEQLRASQDFLGGPVAAARPPPTPMAGPAGPHMFCCKAAAVLGPGREGALPAMVAA